MVEAEYYSTIMVCKRIGSGLLIIYCCILHGIMRGHVLLLFGTLRLLHVVTNTWLSIMLSLICLHDVPFHYACLQQQSCGTG